MIKLLALMLLTSPSLLAEVEQKKEKNTYVSEAPLPKGWPKPGPYDQVSEKSYPIYRVAVTKGGSGMSFWTLFGHIKERNIPMTAPVEMGMKEANSKLEKATMGFLYQDTTVGKVGSDGKKIEVKDIPKSKTLSYTWMGDDSDAQIKTARIALEAALKKKNQKAASWRMLGYNGPSTPKKKRTYELQAILPAK